jgi:hypothetical protein
MIIRAVAALAILATSAWAQTEPPAETTPPATTEAAPLPNTATEPQAEAVAVAPAVPTDPLELAAFALANAREAAQCRFAFSRLTAGGAQFGWSASAADIVARFDPTIARWRTLDSGARQQPAASHSAQPVS